MRELYSIDDLPRSPAVYAMYGGQGRGLYVAYVGVANSLKNRIEQHLVRRDSSVATGTSAAMLNPDHVTRVEWWEHPDFSVRAKLEAAEMVAFDTLGPVLRSRGGERHESRALHADVAFADKMRTLFSGTPAGRLQILTLSDALARISELEQRLTDIETWRRSINIP